MVDLDEPIHVVAYDPAWAETGHALVRDISRQLVWASADVEHIGSTSVPGLDAKPVIDVQVGCASAHIPAVVEDIQRLGFEHLGPAGVPGREYLRRRSEPPANVHVMERDGQLWKDNILFRNFLISRPDLARRYARTKREAADQASTLLAYSALKARTITEIMAAARQAGRSET
ncbi:GrpB family protein [Streptomyces sp. NPDC060209]|uniref:GrpB family protein n=1 Tax=Streptomyces sp. NPDC060209 TaxID=3347073 RepID=UPI0036626865